jgi:hypothetical protein
MGKTKRTLAALILGIVAAVSISSTAMAGPKCAPGQHGNKQPGHKPASCRK